MSFVSQSCFSSLYTEEVRKSCEPFSCGVEDLDDFFREDASEYEEFNMGYSYCVRLNDDPKVIVAIFTLANDSIRIYDLPRSRKDALLKITHHRKRLKRYPGVLLGRLGVNKDFARQGIGSQILEIIKLWVKTTDTIAACRFLIVDAINTPEVTAFYKRNNFKLLFSWVSSKTVLIICFSHYILLPLQHERYKTRIAECNTPRSVN